MLRSTLSVYYIIVKGVSRFRALAAPLCGGTCMPLLFTDDKRPCRTALAVSAGAGLPGEALVELEGGGTGSMDA